MKPTFECQHFQLYVLGENSICRFGPCSEILFCDCCQTDRQTDKGTDKWTHTPKNIFLTYASSCSTRVIADGFSLIKYRGLLSEDRQTDKPTHALDILYYLNKNAFQQDAYRLLQWPSLRGRCPGWCSEEDGCVCSVGVSTGMYTPRPRGRNSLAQLLAGIHTPMDRHTPVKQYLPATTVTGP